MKVIIIGGGIGGLCLANGLLNNGVEVIVFERQQSPSESLAGYGIHIDAHGRRALRRCLNDAGWDRFESTSTPAGSSMTFRDTHLRLLAERDDAQLSGKSISDVERRGIGRTELRQLLLEGLNSGGQSIVRWGKSLTNYEYLPDGRVHVRFTDASSDECDVLIGADGCHSRVRQQLLPQILRQDLGILAIAGRYVLDKRRTKDMPRAFTDGSLNNIVPHGKGWMFLTSWHSQPPTDEQGNERDAEHYVMWAYVVPKAETPPNAKAMNAGQLRDIALTGVQGWSPLLATLIQGADLKTVAPVWLKSMPQLEQWPSSNVTLLGDAIHNMTPMAGIGANTALRDAELLTILLTDAARSATPVLEAINQYESMMRQYANDALALSRRNAESASSGQVFQREAFRVLLRLAQASPPIMRKTIGQSAIKDHQQQFMKT